MRGYLFRIIAILHLVLGVMYLYWRLTAGWGETLWLSSIFLIAEIFTLVAAAGFFLGQLGSCGPSVPFTTLSQTLTELPYIDVFVIHRPQQSPEATCRTARAALKLRYPWHRLFVHIVDGAGDDKLQKAALNIPCEYYRCPAQASDPWQCILTEITTFGEFSLLLESDQIPDPGALEHLLPYFYDHGSSAPILNRTGYVQARVRLSGNSRFEHPLQQPIPINPSCEAAPFLGTAVLIRRPALESITSLNTATPVQAGTHLHQAAWQGRLCTTTWVEGPRFPLRNRRNALLAVLHTLRQNPIFSGQASQVQRFEYLWLALWGIGGLPALIYFCIPILFLTTGLTPVPGFNTSFFTWFLPYVISGRVTWLAAFGPRLWRSAWRAERQTGAQFFQSIQAGMQWIQGTPPQAGNPSQLSLGPQALVILITLIAIVTGIFRYSQGWSVDPAALGFGLAWACYSLLLLSVKPSDYDLTGSGPLPR